MRLVALAMQLEHAVDQVLHRAALLREGGEVTQVPLAGREVFWQVRCPHALVTGDDSVRVQGADRVDAGNPGLALRLIGLVHHHVHVVVDHIPQTTASADGTWKIVEPAMSPWPTWIRLTTCPSTKISSVFSTSGTTGVSGSSPGKRAVQYFSSC